VISHLDFVTLSLWGFQMLIAPTQLALNMAARLIYKAKQSCHVSPILKQLRWLPTKKRVEEKNFKSLSRPETILRLHI